VHRQGSLNVGRRLRLGQVWGGNEKKSSRKQNKLGLREGKNKRSMQVHDLC
jgi:hypothetical protein